MELCPCITHATQHFGSHSVCSDFYPGSSVFESQPRFVPHSLDMCLRTVPRRIALYFTSTLFLVSYSHFITWDTERQNASIYVPKCTVSQLHGSGHFTPQVTANLAFNPSEFHPELLVSVVPIQGHGYAACSVAHNENTIEMADRFEKHCVLKDVAL